MKAGKDTESRLSALMPSVGARTARDRRTACALEPASEVMGVDSESVTVVEAMCVESL